MPKKKKSNKKRSNKKISMSADSSGADYFVYITPLTDGSKVIGMAFAGRPTSEINSLEGKITSIVAEIDGLLSSGNVLCEVLKSSIGRIRQSADSSGRSSEAVADLNDVTAKTTETSKEVSTFITAVADNVNQVPDNVELLNDLSGELMDAVAHFK
ncbi:MAG: hypothetical protein K5662_01130 [Lachnospiraceae bacterium]|nr:hypothetical protein [Lachnospiraceae bacterium]